MKYKTTKYQQTLFIFLRMNLPVAPPTVKNPYITTYTPQRNFFADFLFRHHFMQTG